MSDFWTESNVARDKEDCKQGYLETLADFLRIPTIRNHNRILKYADPADIQSGKLEELLTKLEEGDENTWADFLLGVDPILWFHIIGFKHLSPFSGKFLFLRDRSVGLSGKYQGELSELVMALEKSGLAKIYKSENKDLIVVDIVVDQPLVRT